MTHTRSQPAWGFLTVLSSDEQGLIGGYLILNHAGRPLEFHCTAPVKPSRAQQVLFGPTLEPYLYGEQIGQTLVGKGTHKPAAVYTDVPPALAMRDFISMPVALVLPAEAGPEAAAGGATWRVDAPHAALKLATFAHAQNRLAVAERHRADQDEIARRSEGHDVFDLAEPFQRIRDAIDEAHKQTRS